MRRFAEFGILPGYEFPSEPCTLRLWADEHEEDPITVERRFGISQYQPEARAHARGHRWRVIGLDLASPWNPKSEAPDWVYVRCKPCGLRYGAQSHVACPRCASSETIGKEMPGHEFGGFLAIRDDTPVLEEEERFAGAGLVRCYPQWDGRCVARFALPTGWVAEMRSGEEIRWVNESRPQTPAEAKRGLPCLHEEGRGFYLCPSCGRVLEPPEKEEGKSKGRKKVKGSGDRDAYGHAPACSRAGEKPEPRAITARSTATTLRLIVQLPLDLEDAEYNRWGHSLGAALRTGIRLVYMLDGPEIEVELEPAWEVADARGRRRVGALTLIDAAVGGSGFLDRAAAELHLVAARAMEHLQHEGCESACYRCLKTYQNQRLHQHLSWPHVMPDLECLAQAAPVPRPLERGDDDDPRPWLEAYAAGVGSPLELKFLRLFEQAGMDVEKQIPVAAEAGGKPISTADFVVKGRRVAIYIDSAAFHRGERLRRDRAIRERLRRGGAGWRVVELRAKDLGRAVEVVRELVS